MLKHQVINIIGNNSFKNEPLIDPLMEKTVSYYKKQLNEFKHNNNGLMSKTIIIRECDDTFIPFDYELVLIDKYDLPKLWDVYLNKKDDNNIYLDSRLIVLIMFMVLKYEDDVYIYNVNSKKVINVYRYFAELTGLNNFELSVNRIKQFAVFKLLLSHFLECLNISWSANNLSKNIIQFKSNTEVTTRSFVNILLNYIGRERINREEDYNKNNINKLVVLIDRFFSKDILSINNKYTVEPWNIDGLTLYELCIALSVLRNQNHDISILEFI